MHDVFVVVNFISSDLEAKHLTIGLGECTIQWLNTFPINSYKIFLNYFNGHGCYFKRYYNFNF